MLSPLLAFKMLYGKQSYCYSLLYLFYVVLESEYMSRTDSIIILDYSFSPFLHKNSIYFPIGMWFTMCLWEEQQNKVTRFYSIKFERRERREKRERESTRERECVRCGNLQSSHLSIYLISAGNYPRLEKEHLKE